MESMKNDSSLVDAQIAAVKAGDVKDKIQTLIDIGVLTADHKLSEKYQRWGHVSRTEVEADLDEDAESQSD